VTPELYIYLAVVILLMTAGRVFWRRSAKSVDWELIVAFIRLDFPPGQRDMAQKIAAGLAEIVGLKIKQLRPEHTLAEIVEWAEKRIYADALIIVLQVAYGVGCGPDMSFRTVVEKVVEHQTKKTGPALAARRAS